MSPFRPLREFIQQRLAAAAEEIFREVEKTLSWYEEKRRVLDVSCEPGGQQRGSDLAEVTNSAEEEKVLLDQQLCNPILDQDNPGSSSTKEEQQELHTGEEGVRLALKEEADAFMVSGFCEENDQGEPELKSHQSVDPESQYQEGSQTLDPGSTENEEAEMRFNMENQCSTDPGEGSEPALRHTGHLASHCGEKSYACNICEKQLESEMLLKQHLEKHMTDTRFSCEACGKFFRHHSRLAAHMRTHTGERPYSCEVCGKCFTKRGILTIHMRVHTGEKRYSCEICGWSFSIHCNLKAHMRTHTGEKPYTCKICGKSYIQNSCLKSHMRSHTGEKPYSCGRCGKRFMHSQGLAYHTRICFGQ
ncbi:uncharacterized protein KZ484_020781 [Pholidichthys leucotaenia]